MAFLCGFSIFWTSVFTIRRNDFIPTLSLSFISERLVTIRSQKIIKKIFGRFLSEKK